MKTRLIILLTLVISANTNSQTVNKESIGNKYFISTSLWSLANLGKEPADFYELNFGYKLNANNALILNAITWKYWEPLGIPYGNENKYQHTEDYPGFMRAWGAGLIYQRYIWKGFFSSIHANTFLQNFYDEQDDKIQSGFQLYLQLRAGYRWDVFNHRLFLEPSLSFNYWPVNTNFPDDFQIIEDNWPNYFLFEPHLNIGVNF
jgi:hypothetical protein